MWLWGLQDSITTRPPEARPSIPGPEATVTAPSPIEITEDLPDLLPNEPVPVLQSLTYWNGAKFITIQMRIRTTSGPVPPIVRYTGRNPRQERRWIALVPRALQSNARGTEHVEGSNFDHPSRRTAIPNCMQGASMHACIPHRQAPMQTSLAQRQAANAAWHQCISSSRSATDLIFSAEPI